MHLAANATIHWLTRLVFVNSQVQIWAQKLVILTMVVVFHNPCRQMQAQ